MLTYRQMLKIIDEVMIGEKRTVFGEEADEFREDFKKDVEFADKHGYIIEIPFEFPDPPDDKVSTKGGPGSGNFGHSGRPGKVGGSQPKDGSGGLSAGASNYDIIKKAMLEGEITPVDNGDKKYVKGAFPSTLVNIEGDGRGIRKTGKYAGQNNLAFHEMFAHEFAEAIGLEGLVPITVKRGDASIQHWEENCDMLHKYGEKNPVLTDAFYRDAAKMTILDMLLNNVDRHPGNIIVTRDGHIFAIDHGLIDFEADIVPQTMQEYIERDTAFTMRVSGFSSYKVKKGLIPASTYRKLEKFRDIKHLQRFWNKIGGKTYDTSEPGHGPKVDLAPLHARIVYVLDNMKDYFEDVSEKESLDLAQSIHSELVGLKGGAGSGNFGHAGRPGKRGGSAPDEAGGQGVSRGVATSTVLKVPLPDKKKLLASAARQAGKLVVADSFESALALQAQANPEYSSKPDWGVSYWITDDGRVFMSGKKPKTHTTIAAAIIAGNVAKYDYTDEDKRLAVEIIQNRIPEDEHTEDIFEKRGWIRVNYIRSASKKVCVIRTPMEGSPYTLRKIQRLFDSGFLPKDIAYIAIKFEEVPFEHKFTYEEIMTGGSFLLADDGSVMIREKSASLKGGPGSGNFGHAGRPGKVGGSAPDRSSGGSDVARYGGLKNPAKREPKEGEGVGNDAMVASKGGKVSKEEIDTFIGKVVHGGGRITEEHTRRAVASWLKDMPKGSLDGVSKVYVLTSDEFDDKYQEFTGEKPKREVYGFYRKSDRCIYMRVLDKFSLIHEISHNIYFDSGKKYEWDSKYKQGGTQFDRYTIYSFTLDSEGFAETFAHISCGGLVTQSEMDAITGVITGINPNHPAYRKKESIPENWTSFGHSLYRAMVEAYKGGPGSGNFGHAGRPGKVGGSAPDGTGSGIARGVSGQSSAPGKDSKSGSIGTRFLEKITGEREGDFWDDRTRSSVKSDICRMIAERDTMLSQGEVSRVLGSWASSSNSSLMASEVQLAASLEFETGLGEHQRRSYRWYRWWNGLPEGYSNDSENSIYGSDDILLDYKDESISERKKVIGLVDGLLTSPSSRKYIREREVLSRYGLSKETVSGVFSLYEKKMGRASDYAKRMFFLELTSDEEFDETLVEEDERKFLEKVFQSREFKSLREKTKKESAIGMAGIPQEMAASQTLDGALYTMFASLGELQRDCAYQLSGQTPKAKTPSLSTIASVIDDTVVGVRKTKKYKESVAKQGKEGRQRVARYRKILRASYDITQEFFAEQGITEITLFRGVGEGRVRSLKIGNGRIKYSGNTIESWTCSLGVAERFGRTILSATIPVSKILCTAATGLGCLPEYEFVVFGNDLGEIWSKSKSYETPVAELDLASQIKETLIGLKGGPGSGNFGHAGRPGKVGGSAPDRSGGGIARGARSVRGSIVKPDPRYLNGKNKKEVMEGVEDALSAIERVHGISYYTPIEIGFFSRKKGAMAYFRSIGSAPVDIKINTAKDMDGVAADFTHEYGHYLELTILNLDLSVTNPAALSAFKAVQRAILNSPQMKDFLLGTDPSLVADIEWRSGQKQRHDMRKEAKSYFGSFTEGFARAYMQYIAKKTGHAGMLKKVKRFSCSPGEPHIVRTMGDDILTYFVKSQWDDESFLPIEKAFDDLFDALGWSGGV